MNEKYKQQMNNELKNSSSIAQMFKILGEYYDLENCKPGMIVKGTMISALQQGVKMVSAKPKKQFQ